MEHGFYVYQPQSQTPLPKPVRAITYVVALCTTGCAVIWIFGEMWSSFQHTDILKTLFSVSGMCLGSGAICASINKGQDIKRYCDFSAYLPAFLLILMTIGCFEQILKEESLNILVRSWYAFLFPPAIFFSQIIPSIVVRHLATKNAQQNRK